MTSERIAEICFGTGITCQTGEQTPIPPQMKSFRFTLMRNAMYVGVCYIDINSPDPRAEAERLGKPYRANEIWDGDPCPEPPIDWVRW